VKNNRVLIAFVASLVVAILTVVAVSRLIVAGRGKSNIVSHYVAASTNITAGQKLEQGDLLIIPWASTKPLPDAFTSVNSVVGRIALYPISAGSPVTSTSLAAPGSGLGLVGRIPPGMRAIAIKTDDVSGIDGFLFPGCHVDVLVTYHAPDAPGMITNTVLQDVKVLAAGHQIEPDPSGRPAATVSVVTVLVTPQEAQKVALATAQGQIHFVLRNGSDTADVATSPMEVSQLTGKLPLQPLPFRRPISRPVYRRTKRERNKPLADEHFVRTYLGGETKVETTKF
jgi:pilus assembly protein CpaB